MSDAASEGAKAPRAESAGSPSDARFGPVTVLFGARGGRYPDGNSVLVEGRDETVIIDPALGLVARAAELPRVDRVVNSHCHEDHIAGNHLFPDVPWHVHALDKPGLESLEGMMAIYGYGGAIEDAFRDAVVEQFHYTARPDAVPYVDGDVFDLGGVTITVHHTPGHTRGHSCLAVDWEDETGPRRLLYLGDIELTSFGPYYGDAWSDLEDFERSLVRVRAMEADWYATFHHIGVLAGRDAFLERLDIFEAKIADREQRLLEYLAEPHTLAEIVAHRFVYRPKDPVSFADGVERRSMSQHIDRLLRTGRLKALGDGRYVVP
jgi:glyoxylase-like metal-dependent hydrolase (beta-lactamase superfamily II)